VSKCAENHREADKILRGQGFMWLSQLESPTIQAEKFAPSEFTTFSTAMMRNLEQIDGRKCKTRALDLLTTRTKSSTLKIAACESVDVNTDMVERIDNMPIVIMTMDNIEKCIGARRIRNLKNKVW